MSAKTWALLLASALVCDHLVTRLLPGTGSHQAKGTGPSRFIAPRDYSTKVVMHPTAWAILDLKHIYGGPWSWLCVQGASTRHQLHLGYTWAVHMTCTESPKTLKAVWPHPTHGQGQPHSGS